MKSDTEHPGRLLPVLAVAGRARSRRRWSGLLREPGTVLGLFLVTTLLLAGLLAPCLPLDDPTRIDLTERLLTPSPEHLLGTGHAAGQLTGRDATARVPVYSARLDTVAPAGLPTAKYATIGAALTSSSSTGTGPPAQQPGMIDPSALN